jgi:hypothetical protein
MVARFVPVSKAGEEKCERKEKLHISKRDKGLIFK